MKGWDTLGDKSLQQDIYDFKESLFQVCSCVLINVGTNWTQPRHYISTAKWLHIKFLQHVMGTDYINIVSRMNFCKRNFRALTELFHCDQLHELNLVWICVTDFSDKTLIQRQEFSWKSPILHEANYDCNLFP